MESKLRKRIPVIAAFAVGVALVLVWLLPASAAGWSNKCNPVSGLSMLVGDGATAPDGTVYVISADPNGSITTFKFAQGTCNGSIVHRPLAPNERPQTKKPEGPTEAFHPHISVNSKGDVAVTYRLGGSSNYQIYYQRKPAAASQFNAPVFVAGGYVGGIAIDSVGNIHVVWYDGNGGYYRKYNPTDQVVANVTLTNQIDSEPKIALDSSRNAHVVWEQYPAPTTVYYMQISKTGVAGTAKQVASVGGNALYPYIASDSLDNLHITFQGTLGAGNPYEAYYMVCNVGATNCSSPTNLSASSTNSSSVNVAACSGTPFVGWYDQDSGSNLVFVSSALQAGVQVSSDRGSYNSVFSGPSMLGVIYRDENGAPGYVYKSAPKCTNAPPGPTPTPTVTPTVCPNCPAAINISNDTGPAIEPAVAIYTNTNKLHIVWADGSSGQKDIKYRSRLSSGSFSPPTNTAPMNVYNDGGDSIWPSIAMKGSNVNLTWMDNDASLTPAGFYNLFASRLNAGVWTFQGLPNPSYDNQNNPATAVTSDGVVWRVWLESGDIWAMPSNTLITWNLTANQLGGAGMHAAPGSKGSLYVVWQQNKGTGNHVYFKAWSGTFWRKTIDLGAALAPSAQSTTPDVVVAPSGTALTDKVYVVYATNNAVAGQKAIWTTSSTDGGKTWSAPASFAQSAGAATNPRVALDSNSLLHVTWVDGGAVYYQAGTNTPVVVSSGISNARNPVIAVGSDNLSHIVFDNGKQVFYINQPAP